DTKMMVSVLKDSCGFSLFQEEPLLEGEASSMATKRAIVRFIQGRNDDDFLLFYFSGHGVVCRLGESGDEDDVYLVTCDFSWLEIKEDPDMHISLKWLRNMLYDHCDAGKVLIILDCCYAGNITGHGPDFDREELIRRLAHYFDINPRIASKK